jgi:hypothetical protein
MGLDGATRERSENAGQRKHRQGYGCRWCDERKGEGEKSALSVCSLT